ncbi:hypothetical protein [Nucisporomicrobium flavum]|uniref:hypothetical protein n=1 Tax=Nucisporomicrobium flavum TaxID=2785915 RepID=UPI0018F5D3AD|nr:hypothetical protein [Nucisporomicrobium flavum]
MGITWSVLPIYVRDDWQVETVLLDRGDGLREWVEVRHDGAVEHFPDHAAVQHMLSGQGLDLARFTPVDTIDDGCE